MPISTSHTGRFSRDGANSRTRTRSGSCLARPASCSVSDEEQEKRFQDRIHDPQEDGHDDDESNDHPGRLQRFLARGPDHFAGLGNRFLAVLVVLEDPLLELGLGHGHRLRLDAVIAGR
jgi:hypothetical protein